MKTQAEEKTDLTNRNRIYELFRSKMPGFQGGLHGGMRICDYENQACLTNVQLQLIF